jgi:mono/diheme cytochrome c family protein
MLRVLLALALTAVLSGGTALASAGDVDEYQRILDSNCSQCHPRGQIEQAIERGDDFDVVIAKMLRLGAKLSAQEQQVLGVFWRGKQPLTVPSQVAAAGNADPLERFRAVLTNHCTGCHSLAVVEEAMAQGRSLAEVLELMRKRGVLVSEAQKSALDPFWGSPYKEK